jgi:iron complex outermembrane receptor protein
MMKTRTPGSMTAIGLCAALTGFGGAAPSMAYAQGAPSDRFEEIVVMAQKRTEKVQDVPISMAALNDKILADANIQDIFDLQRLVPNLNLHRASAVTATRLNIRGVGAAGNTAIEPSVATFVDGVYVPRPGAMLATMFDVSGIEVLRGPQGTLFGRNASVGAISLRTALPEDEWSGKVKAEAASGERYRLQGHVNAPLSETTALRIAGVAEQYDGMWKNLTDPTGDSYERFGGADTLGIRATLRSELSDNLTWTARAEYVDISGQGMTIYAFDYDSIGPQQLQNFINRIGQIPYQERTHRTTSQYLAGSLKDQQWSVSSELAYDFDSDFTLKWIGSYRDWDSFQVDGDVTFSPQPILARENPFRSKSHNHELQLISPDDLFDNRFSFVAGVYYFNEKYALGENFINLGEFCNIVVNLAAPGLVPSCQSGSSTLSEVIFNQKSESIAAYTQGTLKITPDLDLTLGIRYTDEKKSGNLIQNVVNPGGALLRAAEVTRLKYSDDQITWRANLSWRPLEDVMLFASFSTGYKSGGFNAGGAAAALDSIRRVYDGESVDNYEAGFKSQWLDRMITANLTFYRMEISGFQDRSFDGLSFVVANAGSLRQQGFELDGQVRTEMGLTFNYGVAYLDSEFTSFPAASGLPGFGGVQDLKGAPATFSPKWQGSVGLQYDGEIPSHNLEWSMRSDVSFISKHNAGAATDNNPQTIQSGYATVSARLALRSVTKGWEVSVFGDNILNKRYCVLRPYLVFEGLWGLRNPTTGGTGVQCVLGQPQTYGISFSQEF